MDSIKFRGGVATVKRLRIHTIALCLRTGALTFEYFRTRGFYEWLTISTASYWSSEELKTLLGDLGRNECKPSQVQMNTVTRKLCLKKLLLHFTNSHVYQCPRLRAYIHAGCDQSITTAARFLDLATSIDAYARDNESQ